MDVTLYAPDGSLEKILPDVCLEYNMIQENWYVHTNVPAGQFVSFVDTLDSDRLIETTTVGTKYIKEFLSGPTDDGVEIPFRVDLNKLTLDTLWDRLQNPVGVVIETERGSSMKVFVSVEEDRTEFYELEGKVNKGLSIIKIHGKNSPTGNPPPLRLIKLSIRDSSKQSCRLLRLAVVYLPTNQDAVIA